MSKFENLQETQASHNDTYDFSPERLRGQLQNAQTTIKQLEKQIMNENNAVSSIWCQIFLKPTLSILN